MAESNGPKRRLIRPDVLRFLVRRTGEICFLKDIVTETGFTERQVQSCIAHLIEEGVPITVETRARAWRYMPEPMLEAKREPEHKPEDDDVFERVGVTRSGKIIVRGDSSTLYVLHELEF